MFEIYAHLICDRPSLTNNFNFLRIFIITTCFFIFLCFINIQTFIFSYNNYWIYT
uniref:Uncharacterized protein n=1 Tax=Meloidogyne enterolobii TaxID=390850 RepID=A0A6V7XT59_MELEN|nr:unnamed protein product [Meloidogyne enterolobii]